MTEPEQVTAATSKDDVKQQVAVPRHEMQARASHRCQNRVAVLAQHHSALRLCTKTQAKVSHCLHLSSDLLHWPIKHLRNLRPKCKRKLL